MFWGIVKNILDYESDIEEGDILDYDYKLKVFMKRCCEWWFVLNKDKLRF